MTTQFLHGPIQLIPANPEGFSLLIRPVLQGPVTSSRLHQIPDISSVGHFPQRMWVFVPNSSYRPSSYPRGLNNIRIFFATLDCSLMAYTGVVILLERLSREGDQFSRVGCRKLEFRAGNSAIRGKLETIFVRQNIFKPDRRPKSRLYRAWIRTLPSSLSGYMLYTVVPSNL